MKYFLVIFMSCMIPLFPLGALASGTPAANTGSILDTSFLCPTYEQNSSPAPGLDLKKGLSPNLAKTYENQGVNTASSDVDFHEQSGLTSLTFKSPSGVNPYLGAGVASTDEVKKHVPGPTASIPEESNIYAYEVGAGIGCDLDNSTKLNLGYRYATNAGAGLTQEDAIQSDLNPVDQGHQISMGIQVGF
jgi:opacity protein-like surface antigen